MATTKDAKEACCPLKVFFKRHKLLLTALVLGLSGFALSYNLLSAYIKTEFVVVASSDLEPYSKILPSSIKIVELPLKSVHPQAYGKAEDVAGQYTSCKIFAGQALTERHVVSSKYPIGISMEIPIIERGIFIPADVSKAVGGLINPGDKVDVIWTPKGASHYSGESGVASKTVVPNAKVSKVITDRSSGDFRGVVITAFPEICERIAYYIESGSIYLSLVPWEARGGITQADAEVWP